MARVEDDVDSSKSERVWTVIVDVCLVIPQECNVERVDTQTAFVWENIFCFNVASGLARWQRSEEKPSHDVGYAWSSSFIVLLILEHACGEGDGAVAESQDEGALFLLPRCFPSLMINSFCTTDFHTYRREKVRGFFCRLCCYGG